tara:strand:+ start:3141 stop:3863 length:723 start_codon:yes stop_codon:yes gene_type:complete
MSDTLYESEILKSLETLDNILSKAQIEKEQPGNHRPMGVDWAGTDVEKEDERDNVPDGTDYKAIKKGQEAREEADVDEYRKGKEQGFWEAEEKEKDEKMDKSVRSGVEVSDFLNELTKSIAVYCADLEDHVVKSLEQIHEENGAMSKAIAENLAVLTDVVAKSQGNIAEYAEGPARGPKSMLDMSKSVSGSNEPELSKSVVLDALMKGVEAGTVSPLDVVKVEQFGVQAINQDVVKSLLA